MWESSEAILKLSILPSKYILVFEVIFNLCSQSSADIKKVKAKCSKLIRFLSKAIYITQKTDVC